MAATRERKREYDGWKKATPKAVILHKLHSEEIFKQFCGLPRPILMSWDDYDKFIHLDDLCVFDLVLTLLGLGVKFGHRPFMLDEPCTWSLAIGRRQSVIATGRPQGDSYFVSLRPATAKEKRALL